ncbi:MAG TPA: MraY family glycosyltransferase [Vicinamibacterales bacterium]
MTIVGALVAFTVTVVSLFTLRPVANAVGLVDVPGGRKRHGGPVPVIGGIAMGIGLAFGSSVVEHPEFWKTSILGVYLLVGVGTIDDRFDLPADVRLIAQTCASLIVVLAGGIVVSHLGAPFFFDLPLGVLATPFTVLFILTLINAFNVIDGIDGLAGGMALLALGALALIGAGTPLLVLAVLLLAVVAGFLLFNLPLGFNRSVRTFMGDAGSTFLGLCVASLGIVVTQGDGALMTPAVGLWLVAVPVFDLFAAVLRRVMEGKSPFAPDHEHLHHVLIEKGLSPRSTLWAMLALAAALAGVGVLGHRMAVPDGLMVLGWFLAFAGYYQLMRRPTLVVRFVEGVTVAAARVRPTSLVGRME